jgi:hypothetical protein
MTYTSDKRLYLDQDGNVSEEPPASGTLLVGEGGELTDEDAAKYGLTGGGAKAQRAAPENKQVANAPANKAQTKG